jgi:uncharacterized protein involved in exopolysaccharide biosynthesis
VLDRAVPPIHKSRPKRSLVVVAGFLIGVAGSLSAALLLERRGLVRAALPSEGGGSPS